MNVLLELNSMIVFFNNVKNCIKTEEFLVTNLLCDICRAAAFLFV